MSRWMGGVVETNRVKSVWLDWFELEVKVELEVALVVDYDGRGSAEVCNCRNHMPICVLVVKN